MFPVIGGCHENRYYYHASDDTDKIRPVQGSPCTFSKIETGRLRVFKRPKERSPKFTYKRVETDEIPEAPPIKGYVIDFKKELPRWKVKPPTPPTKEQELEKLLGQLGSKEERTKEKPQKLLPAKGRAFEGYSPRSFVEHNNMQPYASMPGFLSYTQSRKQTEKSFRDNDSHKKEMLPAKSTFKRYTLSQLSCLKDKIRAQGGNYTQAEEILDRKLEAKAQQGLAQKLEKAGFIEKVPPNRPYEKGWRVPKPLNDDSSDSDVGSYSGI